MQVGVENLAGAELPTLGGKRLLDLHDHLGAGENLLGFVDQRRASGDIFFIRQPGADPAPFSTRTL